METGPNPKKRLLVRSALSAANGSGQQHVKRSTTDAEPEAPIEILVEMGTDTHTGSIAEQRRWMDPEESQTSDSCQATA